MGYNVIFKDDYLEHHGILGQKWGHRNGPPYPLDANDHSAAEKEAQKQRFKLTDEQKKVIKIGTAVVAAGLVAYGGYKVYNKIGLSFIAKAEINGIDLKEDLSKVEEKATNISSIFNGYHTVNEDHKETLNAVNGHLYRTKENRHGCTSSSIAGYLRDVFHIDARGINLEKGPSSADEYEEILKKCFEGCKVVKPFNGRSFKNDPEGVLIRAFGKNANGVVSVLFTNESRLGDSAHSFNFSIKNGLVEWSDYKTGKDSDFIKRVYLPNIRADGEVLYANLDGSKPIIEEIKKNVEIR